MLPGLKVFFFFLPLIKIKHPTQISPKWPRKHPVSCASASWEASWKNLNAFGLFYHHKGIKLNQSFFFLPPPGSWTRQFKTELVKKPAFWRFPFCEATSVIWVSSVLPKQAPAASGVSLHGTSLLPFLCASRRAFAFPLSPRPRTFLLGCSVFLGERNTFKRRAVLSRVTFLPHTVAWTWISRSPAAGCSHTAVDSPAGLCAYWPARRYSSHLEDLSGKEVTLQ